MRFGARSTSEREIPTSLQARRRDSPCSSWATATACRRAAGVTSFCQQPLERLVVEHGVGQQLLEAEVLLLQRSEPLGLRHVHPGILGAPLVEGRRRDVVAPAKLVELRARLVLADDADDLLLGETALAHLSSSRTKVEQIPLIAGPISGGRVSNLNLGRNLHGRL